MFVEHFHGSGAGSLRPQIDDATTELGDKNTFRNQPRATGSLARCSAGDPGEAPRQHVQSDYLLQRQDIKKLILRDCEVTDAGCQVIADIVKVNDTIEESDLPKKSSKKNKITINESAETVEKTKTINNVVRYYHDEATHPDEVH